MKCIEGFWGKGYTKWDEEADAERWYQIRQEQERQRLFEQIATEVEHTLSVEALRAADEFRARSRRLG